MTHAGTLAVAVAASAVTAFFVGRAAATEPTPPETLAASFKESLRDVERALEDIRRTIGERPALATAPAKPAEPAPAPPRADARPPADVAPPVVRPAPRSGESAEKLPPADFTRVEEIHDWGHKEDVRRRWFLVSEAEALAVFGTPNLVNGWESGERWEYWNEAWNLSLCFLRGRLVNVYSTDKRR